MAETLTPMMRQYRRIRNELPKGTILFFRLGDFYEMFFEDAQVAAPILDIALTRRNGVPMCGVPYHAVEGYVARLVGAGKHVAICDQVEDAQEARGIVRREVTRIVTPGTVTGGDVLESKRHHFLTGVARDGGILGVAFLDLSTGLFWGEEMGSAEDLRDRLRRFAVSECVIAEEQEADEMLTSGLAGMAAGSVTRCDDWPFQYEAARDLLLRHFGVRSLEGFGCERRKALVGAAGAVLRYVKEDLRRHVGHIRSFRVHDVSDFLLMDEQTCLNLDVLPKPGKHGAPCLVDVLDATKTAMGGRKLREWVLYPLAEVEGIRRRHDAVERLLTDRSHLTDLREALADVRDLERTIVRISSGSGNARDLKTIGRSLGQAPGIKEILAGYIDTSRDGKERAGLLQSLSETIVPLPELVDLIDAAIVDEPPATLREGGMIQHGYNSDLEGLREASTRGKDWLAKYQAEEQKRTGIKNLKVRHNKVFGYYIEVSKGQIDNVPSDYVRKQTLVNAERYITPELKEQENRILGAQERAVTMEYEIFQEIREKVLSRMADIQAIADGIGQADVLASFSDRALALHYVRPEITESDRISITAGRHPIVEQMPDAEPFVPNDALLDCEEHQMIVITGPNMAGKSTYIRQVALIVAMAQVGSFIPAEEAQIGVVDRIFTRVGASDELARGRSTFMVEMEETANILNNATPRSLIVLDEIGRGTSTFDGISIAWAVAEYLHGHEHVKAKTLFATHYHELTDLARTMRGVQNYNILVREKDDDIVFLRKIAQGGSDKSYGIQVARLAGMPDEVIDRAKEILANLEDGEIGETGQPTLARRRRKKREGDPQMSLFGG